jgi:hypothetical protein
MVSPDSMESAYYSSSCRQRRIAYILEYRTTKRLMWFNYRASGNTAHQYGVCYQVCEQRPPHVDQRECALQGCRGPLGVIKCSDSQADHNFTSRFRETSICFPLLVVSTLQLYAWYLTIFRPISKFMRLERVLLYTLPNCPNFFPATH